MSKIRISKSKILLLVFFYSFGTSHFYESVLGRVWDTGQVIGQNVDPFFKSAIAHYGLFSAHYVPINLYYNFIHPFKIQLSFPDFFIPDPLGNSIFLISPLFLSGFFYLHYVKYLSPLLRKILLSLVVASIGIYIPSVLVFSTGWVQFGARYLLDPMPFLILLLVPIVSVLKTKFVFFLVVLSIYIQFYSFLFLIKWIGLIK